MAYKKSVEQAIKDGKMVSKSLAGTFEICNEKGIAVNWHHDWLRCCNCRVYMHTDEIVNGDCQFCLDSPFEEMPDIHEYGLTPNQLADYRQRKEDEAAYWRYRLG